MNTKIQKVRQFLKDKGLDALIVTKEVNVSYLTGIPISDSCLLLTRKRSAILTDFRYAIEAGRLKGFDFEKIETSSINTLRQLVKKRGLKRIGFEASGLTYAAFTRLKRALKGVVLLGTEGVIEKIRMVKGTEELRLLEKAINITKATFSYVRRVLKPGISEISLAKMIDIYIRAHGGEGAAFPTIVAAGPNAAKPHAIAGARKIKRNEPVIIDLGVRVKGYNSDLTRTFSLGKINAKFLKIYNIVCDAQQRAISCVKPGAPISDIDRAARNFIGRAGFGEQFGHALGHGIGKKVHESPNIFKTAKARLLPGMVFTVEPAIYIAGWGGVRIEDMVLVTKNGCRVLTDDIDKTV